MGGNEQILGLAVLIALGLNHHMTAAQLDAVDDHLFMAAVAQPQRQEQETQPQAERQDGQHGPPRVSPQVAPGQAQEQGGLSHDSHPSHGLDRPETRCSNSRIQR